MNAPDATPAGAAPRRPRRRRPKDAPRHGLIRRLLLALGPVFGGLILDAVDLAALGPGGFILGGAIGFVLAGIYGARGRHRWLVAALSALYCSNIVPFLRFVPLATMVGAWFRFREVERREESEEEKKEEDEIMSEARVEEVEDGRRPPPIGRPAGDRIHGLLPILPALALVIIAAAPFFVWFFCRIEPEPGKLVVLIRKTGRDLPSEQILALEPGQKGIQLEVLAEGRHFRNPYTWGWELWPITDIPAGALGVVTRLFGDDLPAGEVLARSGTKGVLAETLGLGKHRLNPYAYRVDVHDAITIRAGHVGVQTQLVGTDVVNNDLPEDQRNTFLVSGSLKGVVPEVLDPGTYYLNPYVVNVVEVNLQSQRFEMSGADAITFLTLDGFTITVEGTIEFSVERTGAALITHRVGDMEDIVTKVIMPRARGFSRIEGSKYPAIDFIVGETRQQFQRQLEDHLRQRCTDWGVAIRTVLVRRIVVPDAIASISRQREIAVQDARKFEQQTEQAKSKAELVKQEMLALQNKAKVEAATERIRATIQAEQDQQVRTIEAQQGLGVAKVDNQAAAFQAASVRLKAEGDRDAVAAGNAAEAAVLLSQVEAFGSGAELARFRFGQAVAPNIETILTSDGADGLGGWLGPLAPVRAAREVTP